MPSLKIKYIFFCLVATSQLAVCQDQSREEALAEVEQYETLLESMEVEVGRYDIQLLESLIGLAEAFTVLDQFEATHSLLDRAIQIIRTNEGLYTESQFPFQMMMAKNNVRRANWVDANATLEHLYWLYTTKHIGLDSGLVFEFMEISDLHLQGVVWDRPDLQAYHLRAADRTNWIAIQIAERVWAQSDPRFLDLYYRLAMQNYIQLIGLKRSGPATVGLREVVLGSGWMQDRRMVARSYYRLGMEMFRRMRQVIENFETPDQEMLAMVDLYEGDWQVLFSEGDPETLYARAFEKLSEANVPDQLLEKFFASPQILPAEKFYPSVQEALSRRREQAGLSHGQPATDGDQQVLRFVEWSSAYPNVKLPIEQPMLLEEDIEELNVARIEISLEGLRKVSRWIRGRYWTQISVAREFEWLNQAQNLTMTNERMTERLHNLNFRPVLTGGVAQPFRGILEYQFFPVASE